MKRLVLAILGMVVLSTAPAVAQTGDTSGTTPCCGKVCSGTTSMRCADFAPGVGTRYGCVQDPNALGCVGGKVNVTAPGKFELDAGCVCIRGLCFGDGDGIPPSPTPAECTSASVAQCQGGGKAIVMRNDPDCGGLGGAGCNPVCTGGHVCEDSSCVCPSGTTECGFACLDTSTDDANCGGCGVGCAADQTCVDGTCASGHQQCAGDESPCTNKTDCCAGLQCVDNGRRGNHQKVCRHGGK